MELVVIRLVVVRHGRAIRSSELVDEVAPGLADIVGPSHGRPLFAALGSETTASRGSLSVMKATEFERL